MRYFDFITRYLSPHFIAQIRLNAFTRPSVREFDSLPARRATGATGRLIVRDAVAKGCGVVALVRSKVDAADFVGAEHIEGDARDAVALTRAIFRPAVSAFDAAQGL
jgi:hypothetical protein